MFYGYPFLPCIKSESIDFSPCMTVQWSQYCADHLLPAASPCPCPTASLHPVGSLAVGFVAPYVTPEAVQCPPDPSFRNKHCWFLFQSLSSPPRFSPVVWCSGRFQACPRASLRQSLMWPQQAGQGFWKDTKNLLDNFAAILLLYRTRGHPEVAAPRTLHSTFPGLITRNCIIFFLEINLCLWLPCRYFPLQFCSCWAPDIPHTYLRDIYGWVYQATVPASSSSVPTYSLGLKSQSSFYTRHLHQIQPFPGAWGCHSCATSQATQKVSWISHVLLVLCWGWKSLRCVAGSAAQA